MTDTHTHILPGIDDGAASLSESLAMLAACREQGVDTVVLTPHFYPSVESVEDFLQRREEAFKQLQAAVTPELPRLVLGAEVAWCPGIEKMEKIAQLTMGESQYMLLEMPVSAWTREQLDSLWNLLSAKRVIPVLAHVERSIRQQKDGQFQEVADMQIPMQLSAAMFRGFFDGRKALRLMKEGQWMIGSDCHNLTTRQPCMAVAAAYLQRRAPERMAALNWNLD